MKKIFAVLLMGTMCIQAKSQKLGLILKGSSTGIGGEIGYRINPKVLVRAGLDQFKYNLKTNFEDGGTNFDLDGTIQAGTIGIVADYQFTKKIYATGGLMLNNFNTDFKGSLLNDIEFGDIIIKKENVGQINWKVKPKSTIAPYLGIGIGNLLNLNKKLNFGFEVGAILQGPPSFDIIGDGFFSANSSPEFDQAGKLNTTFSSFQFYPVIRLNLAYALKTF